MHIAIIGATGNVGTRLTQLALRKNVEVTAYARTVDSLQPADLLTIVQGELDDTARLASALAGTQSVVVLLAAGFRDTTLLQRSIPHIVKAITTLPDNARPQIVFTSVFGADVSGSRASAGAKLVYKSFLKNFHADRTEALNLLENSGLDYVTVYPVNLSPKGKAVSAEVVAIPDLSHVRGMPVLNMDSAAAGILEIAAKQSPRGSSYVLTVPGSWK